MKAEGSRDSISSLKLAGIFEWLDSKKQNTAT